MDHRGNGDLIEKAIEIRDEAVKRELDFVAYCAGVLVESFSYDDAVTAMQPHERA